MPSNIVENSYIKKVLEDNGLAVEEGIFRVFSDWSLKREHYDTFEYYISWMKGPPEYFDSFNKDSIKNRKHMSGKHLDNARKILIENYVETLTYLANNKNKYLYTTS